MSEIPTYCFRILEHGEELRNMSMRATYPDVGGLTVQIILATDKIYKNEFFTKRALKQGAIEHLMGAKTAWRLHGLPNQATAEITVFPNMVRCLLYMHKNGTIVITSADCPTAGLAVDSCIVQHMRAGR